MNVRQYNVHLNGKSRKKAGKMTIYKYKNGWWGQKILEEYFIPSKVR